MNRWLTRGGALAILILPLLLAPMAAAQTGQLSGKVLDLEGKPLVGIEVTITNVSTGKEIATSTDLDGHYSQMDLPVGPYTVKFDYAKDKSFTDQVKIAPGENTLDENFQSPGEAPGADVAAEKKEESTATKFDLMKMHLANGNIAMNDAQAIRKQVDTARGTQKSSLLTQMNADYETAVSEYQQALQDTMIGDESAVAVIGLIGVARNGLISQQKAVEMLVQDKNLPIVLGNLGLAYDGAGRYQEAVDTLQKAAILKPEAATYMVLGTDLAQVGKMKEASATCDKILDLDPADKEMRAGCYKNMAIVLTNEGKLEDATSPLETVTQLNPEDATAWKLLGDSLAGEITTKEQGGKTCYVLPAGMVEAYQKYLHLDPNGVYAAQVKEVLMGLDAFSKCVSNTVVNKKG